MKGVGAQADGSERGARNDAEAALTAQLASALRKIVSCSAAAHEGGASSDGRRGRRYEWGPAGGAL